MDSTNTLSLTGSKFEIKEKESVFFSTPFNKKTLAKACNNIAGEECNTKPRDFDYYSSTKYQLGEAYLFIIYVNPNTGKSQKLFSLLYKGNKNFRDLNKLEW